MPIADMAPTCSTKVFEKAGGGCFSELELGNADHLCGDPAAMGGVEQAVGEALQEAIGTPCATVVGVCGSPARAEEQARKLATVTVKVNALLPASERNKFEDLARENVPTFEAKLHDRLTAKGVPGSDQVVLNRMTSPASTRWRGEGEEVPEDERAVAPAPVLPFDPPAGVPVAMSGPGSFPPEGIATPVEPAGPFPPGTLFVSGPGPFPLSSLAGAFALPALPDLTSDGAALHVATGLGGFALLTVVVLGTMSLVRRRLRSGKHAIHSGEASGRDGVTTPRTDAEVRQLVPASSDEADVVE